MQSSLKHVDPQHLSRLTSLVGLSTRTNSSEPLFADFAYVVQMGVDLSLAHSSVICVLCYVLRKYHVKLPRMGRKRCQELS
jgi:hypothetical protein